MYQKLIDKGITTVLLEGDIDLYNADEFKKDISGLEGNVVLNCEALNYIDSTGLGVLVSVFSKDSGRLSIVGLKPHLFRIFELTGLTKCISHRGGKMSDILSLTLPAKADYIGCLENVYFCCCGENEFFDCRYRRLQDGCFRRMHADYAFMPENGGNLSRIRRRTFCHD